MLAAKTKVAQRATFATKNLRLDIITGKLNLKYPISNIQNPL